MSEHVGNGYIGKSKGGVLESDDVEPVDGEQELFFKFLTNSGGEGVFCKDGVERTDTLLNLGGGGAGRMVRVGARVGG